MEKVEESINSLDEVISHLELAKDELKGLDEEKELEDIIKSLTEQKEEIEEELNEYWNKETKALNREYERGLL